jgi:hypothetical protein
MGSLLDLFYDFLVCAAKLEQSLQAHRQPFLLLLAMEPTPLMPCGETPPPTGPSLEIALSEMTSVYMAAKADS